MSSRMPNIPEMFKKLEELRLSDARLVDDLMDFLTSYPKFKEARATLELTIAGLSSLGKENPGKEDVKRRIQNFKEQATIQLTRQKDHENLKYAEHKDIPE